MMTDFWLISVPLDNTSFHSLKKLDRTLTTTNLASSFRFPIPEFKVGTLDVLLGMSEDLSRLDTQVESVMRRTSHCLADVMEQSSDKVLENSLVNGDHQTHHKVTMSPLKAYFQALLVDLVSYVTQFQWDRAKYPTSLPLRGLADRIAKQVSQVEAELKWRSAAYSNVKAGLHSLQRKAGGRLQARALTDVVRTEDLVNSEYLTTLLVVVSRPTYLQWERTYESLSEFVVPRSSRKIYEETDEGIFTVTLFRKAVHEFKDNAKQSKFLVREVSCDQVEQERKEVNQLSKDKKEQYGVFVRWLQVNFSEVFDAWIHLKALRVFVESVLRYGLPVNFQALLLQPSAKRAKRLRNELSSLFSHLDPADAASHPDVGVDVPGVSGGQQDYFSYICYQINLNLLDHS